MSVGGDKGIASAVLQTAGDTAKVRLSADLKEIVANGQDLSYIRIAITDKDGILQPNAANRLNFEIEGTVTTAREYAAIK